MKFEQPSSGETLQPETLEEASAPAAEKEQVTEEAILELYEKVNTERTRRLKGLDERSDALKSRALRLGVDLEKASLGDNDPRERLMKEADEADSLIEMVKAGVRKYSGVGLGGAPGALAAKLEGEILSLEAKNEQLAAMVQEDPANVLVAVSVNERRIKDLGEIAKQFNAGSFSPLIEYAQVKLGELLNLGSGHWEGESGRDTLKDTLLMKEVLNTFRPGEGVEAEQGQEDLDDVEKWGGWTEDGKVTFRKDKASKKPPVSSG